MTAYRQQALGIPAAIAAAAQGGAPGCRPRDLKEAATDAPKILLHNVYGWFTRVERGVYALTEAGRAALVRWERVGWKMHNLRPSPPGNSSF